MIIDQELKSQIEQLLNLAHLSSANLCIKRCPKSGNNRLYQVQTDSGVFAAKKYFSHPTDKRNRLEAEFSFLTFAQKMAQEKVPKPYAQIPEYNIALYEFVDGKPLLPQEIGLEEINQAIRFFCLLNDPEVRRLAFHLKNASEACFSIQDHFSLIDKRIDQLQQIEAVSEETSLAQQFSRQLSNYWAHFIAQVKTDNLSSSLLNTQRCISPSDFGFHNVLRTPSNTLRFLDFEYAGWDDPCKMAADFFAQVAIPVPEKFFEEFISQTMVLFAGSEDLIARAHILRPAYQIKWCCIALNVFLPQHLERRKFANENVDTSILLQSQLSKVHKLLQPLEEKYGA